MSTTRSQAARIDAYHVTPVSIERENITCCLSDEVKLHKAQY